MNVMNISTCPTSTEMLRDRGIKLGCSVGKEYHCMVNEKKRHVELCISRSWIQPDHCPEYNTAANRIDVSACDASDGVCPPSIYWSNNSFLYSGCFPEQGTTNTGDPEKDSNDMLVISVVVSLVSLVIICIVCAVLFVRCRRKRHGSKKEEEYPLFTEENTLFLLEEEIKKGRETIDEHRADGTYIPTHAAKKGKSILDEKKILVIQGITGSGKTKTALQIAYEWMEEDESCRKCVYLKSLDDCVIGKLQYITCVILDGCFTRWVLDSSSTDVSKFCLRLHEQIKKHNTIYLIITIHKSIYSTHRSMLQKYDIFSNEHHLTLEYEDYEEKKKILTSHLTYIEDSTRHTPEEKELKKLLSKCTENVGFPSVCWMFTNIPECKKQEDAFFRGCEFVLQKIINKLKKPLKCCLFYAMLRSKICEVDTNDIDGECLNVLKKEYSCDEMTDEQLLEYFGKDNPYFTSRGNSVFSFSQTVIYEACVKKCFKDKRGLFLRFCNLGQVKENIRDKTYKVESGACILTITMDEFPLFAPRFASMIDRHKELEYHYLFQNEIFCRKVHEERKQDENYPVIQNKIPDVHMNWETRSLLLGEKLPKQEQQPAQQQEQQQQKQEQDQQQQDQDQQQHVKHQQQQDQDQQQQEQHQQQQDQNHQQQDQHHQQQDQNQQQQEQQQEQNHQQLEQQQKQNQQQLEQQHDQKQQQQVQHQQQQDQQHLQGKSPMKKET